MSRKAYKERLCAYCAHSADQVCSCKHNVRYCGRECQAADWKKHRSEHSGALATDVNDRLNERFKKLLVSVNKNYKRQKARTLYRPPGSPPTKRKQPRQKERERQGHASQEKYDKFYSEGQKKVWERTNRRERIQRQNAVKTEERLQGFREAIEQDMGMSDTDRDIASNFWEQSQLYVVKLVEAMHEDRKEEVGTLLERLESLGETITEHYTDSKTAAPTKEEFVADAFSGFEKRVEAYGCAEEQRENLKNRPNKDGGSPSRPGVNAAAFIGVLEEEESSFSEASESGGSSVLSTPSNTIPIQPQDANGVPTGPVQFGSVDQMNQRITELLDLLQERADTADARANKLARLNEFVEQNPSIDFFSNTRLSDTIERNGYKYNRTNAQLEELRVVPIFKRYGWLRGKIRGVTESTELISNAMNEVIDKYASRPGMQNIAKLSLFGMGAVALVGLVGPPSNMRAYNWFSKDDLQTDFEQNIAAVGNVIQQDFEIAGKVADAVAVGKVLNGIVGQLETSMHAAELGNLTLPMFNEWVTNANPGGIDDVAVTEYFVGATALASMYAENLRNSYVEQGFSWVDATNQAADSISWFIRRHQQIVTLPVEQQAEAMRAYGDAFTGFFKATINNAASLLNVESFAQLAGGDAAGVVRQLRENRIQQALVSEARKMGQIIQTIDTAALASAQKRSLLDIPANILRKAAQPMVAMAVRRPMTYFILQQLQKTFPGEDGVVRLLANIDKTFGAARLESIWEHIWAGVPGEPIFSSSTGGFGLSFLPTVNLGAVFSWIPAMTSGIWASWAILVWIHMLFGSLRGAGLLAKVGGWFLDQIRSLARKHFDEQSKIYEQMTGIDPDEDEPNVFNRADANLIFTKTVERIFGAGSNIFATLGAWLADDAGLQRFAQQGRRASFALMMGSFAMHAQAVAIHWAISSLPKLVSSLGLAALTFTNPELVASFALLNGISESLSGSILWEIWIVGLSTLLLGGTKLVGQKMFSYLPQEGAFGLIGDAWPKILDTGMLQFPLRVAQWAYNRDDLSTMFGVMNATLIGTYLSEFKGVDISAPIRTEDHTYNAAVMEVLRTSEESENLNFADVIQSQKFSVLVRKDMASFYGVTEDNAMSAEDIEAAAENFANIMKMSVSDLQGEAQQSGLDLWDTIFMQAQSTYPEDVLWADVDAYRREIADRFPGI